MARPKGFRYKVEDLVNWGYKNGLWQSLIINISVLLVLALTFVSIDRKTIPIALVFSTLEETQEIDFSKPEPVQIDIVGSADESFVDDSYLVDTPAEGEMISVNLDYDNPVDVSPVKEFAASDLLADLKESKEFAINPWAEAPVDNSRGKPSRRGSGGNGNGSGGNGFEKIEERLKKYKARTGDVQVSISWDDYNDIDVWVRIESRQYSNHISWTNRQDPYGGMLDIDCNVRPTTKEPIENIFWPKGSSPSGNYTVYIHRYKRWEQNHSTNVDVRMLFDGKVINRRINVAHDNLIKVFTFTKKTGSSKPQIISADSPLMDRLMGDPMPGY